MKEEKLNILCGLEVLTKGESDELVMGGIASTSAEDSDGDILLPEGADLDYFLNFGVINFNHIVNGVDLEVGYPKTAFLNKSNQIEVDFGVFKERKLAMSLYDYAKKLSKQDTSKKLGLSIEAIVIERDKENPKVVNKWRMTGLAITPTPKNGQTSCIIKKGETVEYEDVPAFMNLEAKSEEDTIYDLLTNEDMKEKLREALIKGETVEGQVFTTEDINEMQNFINNNKPKEEMDQEVLIKAITEAIDAKGAETKAELEILTKGYAKSNEMVESLSAKVEELTKGLAQVDNTPVPKATEVEVIAKGEAKAPVIEDETIEINISTEEGIASYNNVIDVLSAENLIKGSQARGAKMAIQATGKVPTAILDILKSEGVNITNA